MAKQATAAWLRAHYRRVVADVERAHDAVARLKGPKTSWGWGNQLTAARRAMREALARARRYAKQYK